MKKLVAISFLFLHLFSLYGNMAVYAYCVYRSDKLFNEQVSKNNYKIDDLVEVKVPVKMPTIQNWQEYVSISGQVQLKENCYNYVKLKMTRDTMYLMCIPNYQTTKLNKQNIIDARNVADIPFNKKDHVPFGKGNNLGMFNYTTLQFRFSTPVTTLKQKANTIHPDILNPFVTYPGQPPETLNNIS
ncbi:MAG: hypothetical protein ACXVI9_14130 [Mucilaginibacter sp.]